MVQNYDNHGILKNRRVNNPNLVPNLVTQVTRPDTLSGGMTKAGTVIEFQNVTVGSTQTVVNVGDDIQNSLDNLNSLGGGTLFLRNGTHFVNKDLILYSNIYIQGENVSDTVVDFGGKSYGFRIKGSNVYNTGTVSVVVGGTTVTGTGTAWTSNMIGRQIMLSGYAYNVLTVPSGTSLTIDQQYTSPGLSGNLVNEPYAICTSIGGVECSDFTVQNSADKAFDVQYTNITIEFKNILVYFSNYGFYVNQCGGFIIDNGYVFACNYGAYFYNSDAITWITTSAYNTVIGDGIYFNNTGDSTIFNFSSANNNGNGITFVNAFNTEVSSGTINDNSGKGVEFVSGTTATSVEACTISGNVSDGVKLTATSSQNIIGGNVSSSNGGWGINIANANCSNNIINGNVYVGNTAGTYTNSGTSTRIF